MMSTPYATASGAVVSAFTMETDNDSGTFPVTNAVKTHWF